MPLSKLQQLMESLSSPTRHWEKGDLTFEEQDDLVTAVAALNRAIRTFERMYEQAEKDSAEEREKKRMADLEQQVEAGEVASQSPVPQVLDSTT
ncbi:hypothetical protein BJ165DRAFT_192157 [Panaeolus papilionaceus]|nr:hypothetical protein BJ165DRAFT_192157 [Panaeolus papilionaceus]